MFATNKMVIYTSREILNITLGSFCDLFINYTVLTKIIITLRHGVFIFLTSILFNNKNFRFIGMHRK